MLPIRDRRQPKPVAVLYAPPQVLAVARYAQFNAEHDVTVGRAHLAAFAAHAIRAPGQQAVLRFRICPEFTDRSR